MTVERPYRGVSAEQRRTERRAQLLEGCREVIGRDGVAATTVGAVCEQAGLTKRYFYESFTDLDAILAEVLEGLFTTVRTRILDALEDAGDDPHARALATIDQLVTTMTSDQRLARLYVEAPAHAVLLARRERAYDTFARLWVHDVLGVAEPDATQLLAGLLYVSGTTQAVVSWLQGAVDLDRDELVAEIARLGLRRAS